MSRARRESTDPALVTGGDDRSGRLVRIPRRRIGRYDLLASVGRGGGGQVFVALRREPHEHFRRLVVLKLLHSHFEADPQAVDMFLDEARLAVGLDHPNIVQSLELGVEGDQHYLVMSYLEGKSLAALLAARRQEQDPEPIEPRVAAFICAQVLRGLHHAHELEGPDGLHLCVVHRDVSPSNIHLTWDGAVKLLDFGIAKASTRRANTDSGVIKGKFGYISPEQALGGMVDRRADVWSAGVVLWEMLTGRRLFPRRNDVTTLRKLVVGELPRVRDRVPDAPEALAAIIDRALVKEPDQRYADARQMGSALEKWLEHEPALRPEDVAALLQDTFPGEQSGQQAMLADLVGGALAVTPTGSFAVFASEPKVEPRPVVREPGYRWPTFLALAALVTLGVVCSDSDGWLPDEPPADLRGSD